MIITDIYLIQCDACGSQSKQYCGSVTSVNFQYEFDGGTVLGDKHYCTDYCAEQNKSD